MDQRRFLVFFTVSMLIWIGWINFLVPMLFPQPPARPVVPIITMDDPADALFPENSQDPEVQATQVPQHPRREVQIGPSAEETDPDKLAEFFLSARFRSAGASIENIELTDQKRYPAFGHRDRRLRVVGADPDTSRHTFGMQVPAIEALLKGESLDTISWEVTEETPTSVTFGLKSPDGIWELSKKYKLKQLTPEEQKQPDAYDTLADGYKVTLSVTLKNLSNRDQEINYLLQGPTGIPLEDADNAYKYRDVRMGFLRDDGSTVDASKLSAGEVVKKEKAKAPILWKRPIRYIGIDVAYFAALVLPVQDQARNQTLDNTHAVVVHENKQHVAYSDISVDLVSKTLTVPAQDSVEHEYVLFAGPKRQQLLQQVYAGSVLDYGWFDSICRGMVWILNLFHSAGLSYGLAIICLTVVVRTLLIPLSRHQAIHAAKMKELQPKIQARQKELEARHGKNTEEYIKASQELVAEQSKMMLGGCLPMLLQLPIFMALYRSLSSSIELRMEPFLWFENLASPDALFSLPGRVPFLGWTEFNLLPWISIGLMVMHQKLTMPPPTNDEQRAQYKMMNVMMFVMGATFYRVPAGLCLYFIATNVWSMIERRIFEKRAKELALLQPAAPVTTKPNPNAPPPKPSAWMEWLKRLQEAADKDVSIRREDNGTDKKGSNGSDKKGSNGSDQGGNNGPDKGGKKRSKR